MRRMLRIVQLLCGLAILYVTIGGLIGLVLPRIDPNDPRCLPRDTGYGFQATCTSAAADLLWVSTLGVPRGIILFAGMAAGFVKSMFAHIRDPQQRIEYLMQAAIFSGISIPLGLAAWASFAYWKRLSKPIAIGLTLTLIGEILFLGWHSE
jgi:xanthine/uracil permease